MQIITPKKASKPLALCFSAADTIATAVALAILVFTFGVRTSVVVGDSMLPTLHNGQRLIITASAYHPRYGDIVVVSESGTKLPEHQPIVKRVIGVAGDTIDIDFERGVVYLNGAPLEEPYIAELTHLYNYWGGNTEFPCTVPEGRCFIMGDNRNDSTDSRAALVGLVDVRNIVGVKLGRK